MKIVIAFLFEKRSRINLSDKLAQLNPKESHIDVGVRFHVNHDLSLWPELGSSENIYVRFNCFTPMNMSIVPIMIINGMNYKRLSKTFHPYWRIINTYASQLEVYIWLRPKFDPTIFR